MQRDGVLKILHAHGRAVSDGVAPLAQDRHAFAVMHGVHSHGRNQVRLRPERIERDAHRIELFPIRVRGIHGEFLHARRVDEVVLRLKDITNLDFLAAEGLHIMHERPAVLGRNHFVVKRRHRRAGQTCGRAQIKVPPRVPAAKRAAVEIPRWQRETPEILQPRRRRSHALAGQPVAGEAIKLAVNVLAARQGLHGHRRFGWNLNRLCEHALGLLLLEKIDALAGRVQVSGQVFDVWYHLAALRLSQVSETRHRTARHAACDRAQQILVAWHKTGRRGLDFEQAGIEVSRLGVKPHGCGAVAVAVDTVAGGAVLIVNGFAGQQGRIESAAGRRRSIGSEEGDRDQTDCETDWRRVALHRRQLKAAREQIP